MSAPLLAAVLAGALLSPQGLRWGASPQEVQAQLSKVYKFIGPNEPANLDQFLHEQRWEGELLGMQSDDIAPLFYAGQFFSLAASFSPSKQLPATQIWETLVAKLTQQFGKPATRTKPRQLVSWNSMLALVPEGANKSMLMELYNQAEKDRALGRYLLLDLEVAVGMWVPEATWTFSNGAVVKAVMRAGAKTEYGLVALKPAVLYTRHEQLK